MTAVLLFLVVVALLGFIGWQQYDHSRERERLINRLIAKTPSEVRVLDNEPRERITPAPRKDRDPEDEFWQDGFEPVGI